VAALIAWMLVVRIDDLVKDGAISAVTRVFDALRRRRLRRSTILDKIANTNRVLSMRSRPLSRPYQTNLMPRRNKGRGEMIEIAKALGGYVAHATPPHVKAEWRSDRPMAVKDVIAELLGRGAHQTDIGDAFYLADPNWVENSN
jgi:hypothetical protein